MNMDIIWKKFMMAALIRAIRTFAQTFVSMVAVGGRFLGSGMGEGAVGQRSGFCAECADESGDRAAGGGMNSE